MRHSPEPNDDKNPNNTKLVDWINLNAYHAWNDNGTAINVAHCRIYWISLKLVFLFCCISLYGPCLATNWIEIMVIVATAQCTRILFFFFDNSPPKSEFRIQSDICRSNDIIQLAVFGQRVNQCWHALHIAYAVGQPKMKKKKELHFAVNWCILTVCD